MGKATKRRPLEIKLKRLSGKNKLVKENAGGGAFFNSRLDLCRLDPKAIAIAASTFRQLSLVRSWLYLTFGL